MTFPVGTLLGRYQLLELLHSGHLSEVYRARDTSIGRTVAVKVLPRSLASEPGWLHRFEQEARAAGQLDHPNIVSIHDVGVHEGCPYLVSEWLEGETLRERLAVARLPWRKAVAHAIPIVQGIAVAHEKGIAHRDLKPENIFLTTDGRIKILDFGLAGLMPAQLTDLADPDSPTAAMAATEPGTILGTVGYMSPEQVRGQPADARADIFSFGVILYEMVTGQRAFQAGSAVETMMAILRENPAPIPPTEAQSSSLERIIFRCIEKSPGERFQSARDVAYALEDLLAGSPERLPRASTLTAPTPSPGKRSGSSGGPDSRRRSRGGESGESSGYWLIFRDREVPLREGETILGRGREATIRLGEKGISRQHARIVIRDGAASIEDLKSKNGTFLRGAKVEKPAPLVQGDEIRLGTLSMLVQFAPKTASTESDPPELGSGSDSR